MYCNAVCKKRHRHLHKKECENHVKRAAENEAELKDEKLFKQPPPLEDCPICMIRLPTLGTGREYMACCGKVICCGCLNAPTYDHEGNIAADVCPFCRTPPHKSNEEGIKRYEKRIEMNDSKAITIMGYYYDCGLYGIHQNMAKAFELWHQAAELGSAGAYYGIGNAYHQSHDEKKAMYYYELAAIGGDFLSRHNLGAMEARAGNRERALRHWMIAVKDGNSESLESIERMYSKGHATKDDYAKALRSYQAYIDEIKSDQRDETAAFIDRRYY